MSLRTSIPSSILESFTSALSSVYGPFPDTPDAWSPPDLKDDCHGGRYLWTDAFGVINFVTLYRETQDAKYLSFADKLVEKVHNVLGKTRDGKAWLLEGEGGGMLKGGLRIGKEAEGGEDGDGQYWHYLVLWIFALLRLHSASSDDTYTRQARTLAAAMYRGFVLNVPGPTLKERPRIPWKISTDGKSTLVSSEGNLDPYDGLVMFSKLIDVTGVEIDDEDGICVEKGLEFCKRRVETKWRSFGSSDPLDLGMALWTSSWWEGDWAAHVRSEGVKSVLSLDSQSYFSNTGRRLAFRDFGAAMGLKCTAPLMSDPTEAERLESISADIVKYWEGKGYTTGQIQSINTVMYAAALWPGAFKHGYFDSD